MEFVFRNRWIGAVQPEVRAERKSRGWRFGDELRSIRLDQQRIPPASDGQKPFRDVLLDHSSKSTDARFTHGAVLK